MFAAELGHLPYDRFSVRVNLLINGPCIRPPPGSVALTVDRFREKVEPSFQINFSLQLVDD